MKKQILMLIICFISSLLNAKPTSCIVVLPITDYTLKLNDSITVVQVQLPIDSKVTIKEKTLGMLLHKYDNEKGLDSSTIGYGRCNLIKGSFYYFTIKLEKNQIIAAGDLLHFKTDVDINYKGWLADLSLLNIQFTDVYEKAFYSVETPYSFTSDNEEWDFINKIVEDIKFTAKTMSTQMPENNTLINEGRYKGTRLFDKMKTITGTDIVLFFSYVLARPSKYKGNTWKISETFATWMHGGAPEVIK